MPGQTCLVFLFAVRRAIARSKPVFSASAERPMLGLWGYSVRYRQKSRLTLLNRANGSGKLPDLALQTVKIIFSPVD